MTTFAPVREAYRLWLLTAPQLTLDVDDLTKIGPGTTPLAASEPTPSDEKRPGPTPNTNAIRRTTFLGSAADGSQETL